MRRRQVLAAAAAASLAGCAGLSGDVAAGRLDLTVQNEGSAPVTARVEVVGEDGTTYESASDSIAPGVARAFEVTVGPEGRHEATVTGADWAGRLAWDAGTCALYAGTVRVSPERVAVESECTQFR
jgi:hypothetical protein